MEWWCRLVFRHLCKVRVRIRHVCPTTFHQTQQYKHAIAPSNATLQRRNKALLSTTLISFHVIASRRPCLFVSHIFPIPSANSVCGILDMVCWEEEEVDGVVATLRRQIKNLSENTQDKYKLRSNRSQSKFAVGL